MKTPPTVFHETYDVRAYEVNPNGRASIQTIGNYLQDIAGKHAEALGVSHLMDGKLAWVLSYICVQVDHYPTLGDTIVLETWPSGISGVYATRDFLLMQQDGRPLGAATSAWLLLDLDRRRPIRMPEYITSIRLPDRPRALNQSVRKLRPPKETTFEKSFAVRYSDLDLNAHVNNVRYMEWAVESIPLVYTQDQTLHRLELQFKAETHYGETIHVATGAREATTDHAYAHRLTRASDGKEVAVVHSFWRPTTLEPDIEV